MKPRKPTRQTRTAVERYLRRKGVTSWADIQRLDPDDTHQHRHLRAVITGLFPDWSGDPDETEALYQTLHRLRDNHQSRPAR